MKIAIIFHILLATWLRLYLAKVNASAKIETLLAEARNKISKIKS